MKIDRKRFSDVSINSSKYGELYFDIDENTLVVKTSDGKFLVKQNDIPEGEINFKEIMREDDELSLTYPAQVGFLVDGTTLALPKNGADAYKLSDGTIYLSEEMESDTITHDGDYEWLICYFYDKHIPSDLFIDLPDNSIKWLIFKNCEFDNENYCIIANFYMNYSYNVKISFINSSTINVTKFSRMFSDLDTLSTIPKLNTSNGTDFSSMFAYCLYLSVIPQLDTSNGTNFSYMFSTCFYLTTIPQLDTSNGTNFSNMFEYCYSLTTIPQLDTSNGTNFVAMFNRCESLTNLGGFKGLKVELDLSESPLLTHESLMNVINNLAESDATLTLGSTNLAKLTDDEKAIAINKGWTLE